MTKNKVPRAFGLPLWRGLKRRVGKKWMRRLWGPDWRARFERLDVVPGALVQTCTGFNAQYNKLDTVDFLCVGKGRVVYDLHLVTSAGGCSVRHCGVCPPITYEEAERYRTQVLDFWAAEGDPWGFCARYSPEQLTIHPDGTFSYNGP